MTKTEHGQRSKDVLALNEAFERCRPYMTPVMKRELFAIITILEDTHSNPALPSPDRPAQDKHETANCQHPPQKVHPGLQNAWSNLKCLDRKTAQQAKDKTKRPRTTPPGRTKQADNQKPTQAAHETQPPDVPKDAMDAAMPVASLTTPPRGYHHG